MKVFLSFKDYLRAVVRFSNEPVSMRRLMKPFACEVAEDEPDQDLLMGFVLDQLTIEFKDQDKIDCLDVAIAAADLGYAPAVDFLDHAGPQWMANAITKERNKPDIC